MIRPLRPTAPRPASDAAFDVAHDGRALRVEVKRSASARRLTLRVRAATRDVVVTVPRRTSLAAARAFVEGHAGWIASRLARLPAPAPFRPGARIALRGVEHEIVATPGARGTVRRIEREGQAPALCVAGAPEHLARRLADYLKREARRDLEAAVARHAGALGVRPSGMTLRDTRSRWGSCTAQGALNFSWRLIFAPPMVLDYLAAHEVAHLVHLDHSARFWKVTRRLAPHTDEAEAWLKAHGASLHRYGAQGAEEGEPPAPPPEEPARDSVQALIERARAQVMGLLETLERTGADAAALDRARRVA